MSPASPMLGGGDEPGVVEHQCAAGELGAIEGDLAATKGRVVNLTAPPENSAPSNPDVTTGELRAEEEDTAGCRVTRPVGIRFPDETRGGSGHAGHFRPGW